MVCLLQVSLCSATSCSGTFPVEYPARLAVPYRGLWLPPETTKGSGHCEGGWWGGSSWWLCLLHKKLAHNCHSCVSSASAEGPHNIASTVPSPPCISDTAFSLGNYAVKRFLAICRLMFQRLFAARWWAISLSAGMRWSCAIDFWRSCAWSYQLMTHTFGYCWFCLSPCLILLIRKVSKGNPSPPPCSVGPANPYLPL